MSKVICIDWRPCERNTLRGFANFLLPAIELHIRDCAVHESHGKQWVQLPARPQLDQNRELVRGADGKVRYAAILAFDSTEAAADFNDAALRALQDFELGITGSVLLASESVNVSENLTATMDRVSTSTSSSRGTVP